MKAPAFLQVDESVECSRTIEAEDIIAVARSG